MRRVLACAALVALCTSAAAAAAALPRAGTLVPGTSLGGVRLGDTAAEVRAALGTFYGVCEGCERTTLYFTYRPFEQRGLAVELTRGRVSAVYTLWRPGGWHSSDGLRLGAPEGQATSLAGPLVPVACTGYGALVRDARAARTAYYVVDDKLWGFGLFRPKQSPCR
jgi:hypothetical protein